MKEELFERYILKQVFFTVLVIFLVGCLEVATVKADTFPWIWESGTCVTEEGGILTPQTIGLEPGTEVCVMPPSYQWDANTRWYVSVTIGGAYFAETAIPTFDPSPVHCATVSSASVIIDSLTTCTVLPRYSGTITYAPPTPFCSTCAECNEKLSLSNLNTVYLANDISNQAGSCINNPAGFNDKIFDCQGYTIDGNDDNESFPDYGIYLSGKSGNTIQNCTVTDFQMGIVLWESSNNNTVANNTVSSNTGIGIDLQNNSSGNTVSGNTVESNRYDGLRVQNGSNSNIISGNTVTSHGQYGIYIYNSNDNDLTNNTTNSNQTGIYLSQDYYTILSNNTSNNNQGNGITMYSYATSELYFNTFCDNYQVWTYYYDIADYYDSNIGDNNKCDKVNSWNDTGTTGCTYSCSGVAICGDGSVTPPEECDDGNTSDGDGCRADCTWEVCGDTILDIGEECDDGNTDPGDGCRADCTVEICGDAILDVGEECDDGNTSVGDGCRDNCTVEICGDAILDAGEECDDGNLLDGDGCAADCTQEAVCGDGVVDAGEQCDDGNIDPGDGCRANCTLEICGDGIADPGEECDDGNLLDGDGCDSNCLSEPPENTPPGSDVTVNDETTGTDITFSLVTEGGETSVAVTSEGPVAPAGFMFVSSPPVYYDIATTATYTGNITVCVEYDDQQVVGLEDNLQLMHWIGTAWEDSTIPPVDTTNNIICGSVTSLSPFAVMETTVGIGANVDLKPETLNLKSQGKWITLYIELPEGYDVADISIMSIRLEGIAPAEGAPVELGDYDQDGVADLMVKFSRGAVQEELDLGDAVSISVIGELDGGQSFIGIDTLRVIALH